MLQSGVGEVYRLLHFEDGHVVLDRTLSLSYVKFAVDFCLPRIRLSDKCFRFKLIRDIMLAWKIMTLEILDEVRNIYLELL